MKYFMQIIILTATLAFSAEIMFKYNFDEPVVKGGKVFMTGCDRSNIAFSPATVLKQVRLLLPDGEKAVSYKVDCSEPVILDGEYDLVPVEASGRLSVNPPAGIKGKRSEVYSKDEFFPAKPNSDRFFTQYKNGHPVFMTILNPVQYNPVSKTVKYYRNITLTVHTTPDNRSDALLRSGPDIEASLKKLVDNPQEINFQAFNKAKDGYDYLIITPSVFAGSFSTFTAFNYRRGLVSSIKTVEDILTEMTGGDTQEKIRNFIIQEYTASGITYVLLAGDTEYIPHRGFRAEIMDYGTDYYDETDIPADMYYGCLDGTWQMQGSGYFGEPGSEDLLWEVYVSRFPAGSTTDITNMVSKTIQYSESPVTGKVAKNLLVGELLWEEGGGPGWVDSYGGDCMDEMVGYCDHNSYETTGFGINWTGSQLYDRELGYWYKSDLFAKIKNDDVTWIDHLGHSNNTYNMRMTNSDITTGNFDNDGVRANSFIIYSQGCYSGSFDNRTSSYTYTTDCIGEAFVIFRRAAVAYIGNSRYGLGSPYDTDGSGQRFHRYFHDAAFDHEITKIEKMNTYSKEINAPLILEEDINLGPYFGQCKWIAYCVNVLGDPALDVWTAEPQIMNVSVPGDVGMSSASGVIIDTDVPDAVIAVYFEGSFLYALTADANGDAAHSVPQSLGTLEYYITGHNYLQAYASTEVVA
ncbi:MAG TPA: C25 family cysteine peptidase, partial [Clostridiales bacterium]|nr:C25 family cysteine peptidase [Clostridiales bacterium]